MHNTPSLLGHFTVQVFELGSGGTFFPMMDHESTAKGNCLLKDKRNGAKKQPLWGQEEMVLELLVPLEGRLQVPPEPYFKQIKDILNNEDGEERLEKAGLKPEHRPLLSCEDKRELQSSDKKRRDGWFPPEAASMGTGNGSHQDPTKDRGHWGLTGLCSFMLCQFNSLWSPNILFLWIYKKNNRGGRVMEGRDRQRETPRSMKHVRPVSLRLGNVTSPNGFTALNQS